MKPPSVGDEIYVPTIGEYFIGGLARINQVIKFCDIHRIVVEEHKNVNYLWEGGIADMQNELKLQFGKQRAYSTGIIPPCPLESILKKSDEKMPKRKREKLTGTDLSVMSFIEEYGPISFEDLCYDESSKPVMEEVLKKLLRLGYIKKDENGKYS